MACAHDNAVGGCSFDGEATLADLAQAQRIIERKRMRNTRLIELGRNHPDILRQGAGDLGARVEPLRMDAVIIGEEMRMLETADRRTAEDENAVSADVGWFFYR